MCEKVLGNMGNGHCHWKLWGKSLIYPGVTLRELGLDAFGFWADCTEGL